MVFDAVREELRQEAASDADFLRAPVYYFELRVPPESNVLGSSSFVFPLVLAPQQLSIEEPFSLAETETQGGGLYVERNGVVRRTIKIRGTTGFKPRRYLGDAFQAIRGTDVRRGSNRDVLAKSLDNAAGLLEFSGQRHFQFLQDGVFRTYSDLLQSPAFAAGTSLVFHNPKDDEHWLVEPRRFSSERDQASSRFTYPWDIELLAYAPADDAARTFSEDKGVIDALKNGLRMVNSAVNTVRGGVRDVTALVQDLDNVVSGFATTVNNVVGVVDDAADFASGVTNFVTSPLEAVTSVTVALADGLDRLGSAGVSVPDAVFQSLRQVEDGFDQLAQFPQFFQTDSQRSLSRAQRSSELSTSNSRAELREAADAAPPNSFAQVLALGTGNLPGDLLKADGELGVGRDLVAYQSASEYVVAGGDTLQNMASRFLGDAREWRAIAALNGLEAPYVSETGLPNTVGVGDRVLIPSVQPPPVQRTLTPVLGVDPAASGAERLLGTDLLLERTGGPANTVDLAVDVEGGSVDFRTVTGVPNLAQGLLTRVETEKGTNQLYRGVGVDRVVATASAALNRDLVVFRIGQAVRADPRVVSITNIRTGPGSVSADAILVDLDVQPVNFSGSVPVAFEI